MKIGFDAKRAFNNSTGLGNYSRSIINSISHYSQKNNIYLFTTKYQENTVDINHKNTQVIKPNIFTNKEYWRFYGVNSDIQNLNIDIFHGLSNELPIGLKTKKIVTIHDLLFLKYPHFYNFIDRKIYDLKSKNACNNADKIIAVSQKTKNDIIDYYNINPKKIEVIYQTCHDHFINPKMNVKIDSHLKKKLSNPYILYVGSIEERKNLIFLLKAMTQINHIKLICIGKKTNYYKKVEKFISKHNLRDKIYFLNVNNTEKLSFLYRNSIGLVYPSIDEGFGIPIIEAMYSKIPVLISDKKVFKEIGGKYAYYFQQNKIDSLIYQINQISTQSDERNIRIEKNLNYVQKFNQQQQTQKIIDLYKELIQ